MRIALTLLPLLLGASLLTGGGVHAAVHACRAADGTTVFQDRPCERVVPAATARRGRDDARTPLGLHESWFARPEDARFELWCDGRRCECGAQVRRLDTSLETAVADALYLDGAWYRHATSHAAWRASPTASGERALLRQQADEAACDVLIAQRTLRVYGRDVLASLRRRVRAAEERGFDEPEPCEAGDAIACEGYDAVSLHRRMRADLATLRQPREGEAVRLGEGAPE